ncbi:MAG: DUF4412 domain-containing protein [Thermoanaerobaculia bacterium]
MLWSRPYRVALMAALGILAAVVPAAAGLYFEQRITSSGDGQGMEMAVRGWAEAGKARVEFVDSNNPVMGAGTYLLTTDGGQTVYLVNPEERTYSHWDLAAIMSFFSRMGEATGGMVQMDFKDPVSERLSSQPGESVLGYPTTHYRWKSGYTADMKIAFMDRSDRYETATDAWATTAIEDPALFVWLRAMPPTTGDPELDTILAQEARQAEGLVLKMEQATTTTSKKGETASSTTRFEVTTLREEAVDESLFAMPSGYAETPLLPGLAAMQAQQGEAEAQPQGPVKALKGLFGKKKDG